MSPSDSAHLSLSETWRHAAREVSGVGKGTTQFREDVADEVARIVLEAVLRSLTENEYEETVQMVRDALRRRGSV